ncbi:MAG: hypothetical protein KDM91_01605 [Verrucomicrobiae bacterium]|nr:hypothetical protein [Verrucomicrobiae bacterium]
MSQITDKIDQFRQRPWVRNLSRHFGIPKFHRFEVVFMRVLFAYLLFQTMPLDAPFSNNGLNLAEKIVPGQWLTKVVGDKDLNTALRPLPPINELLPSSEVKIPYDSQPRPDGLAKFFDLTFFNDDGFVKALRWIVIPCLVLYACGRGLPVVLPILCFVSIGSRTLYNSQGYIYHGFHMVSLVLLAQTIVVLWALFKNPREAMGFRKPSENKNGRTWWDVLIRYSQLMIIASYMIPGVIKQFKSGGEWFLNSHYIGVQVVKTHRQNFYNDLDADWAPDKLPKLANFMLEHRNWTRLLLGCGVGLQCIALLGLYNRLTNLIFGVMFILFHWLNDLMFGLYFYHVEKMDWIFLVNLPFWAWWLWRRARKRPVPLSTPEEARPAAA